MHMNLTIAAERRYKKKTIDGRDSMTPQFKKFFEFRHLNIDKTQNFNYNYNEDKGRRKFLI